MKNIILGGLAVLLFLGGVDGYGKNPLKLWYGQPAIRWMESLPVGNGRMGVMIFGGVKEERLALNETTFWSGEPSSGHDNPGAVSAFNQARELFRAGKNEEVQPLISKMLGQKLNYGTNLPAGDLIITQTGIDQQVTGYSRELDLENAVASVTFRSNGILFRRQLIASHPDGIVVMRLTAGRPRAISITIRYDGGLLPSVAGTSGGDILKVTGHAYEKTHSDGKTGVAFAMLCHAESRGGKFEAKGDRLEITGADEVIIRIALNTSFGGKDPVNMCENQLGNARERSWDQLLEGHTRDYQKLYNRVTLSLGKPTLRGLPTDSLKNKRDSDPDPLLAELFFQYGRYLMIAGSRDDSPLPMHLQGIWNDALAAKMGWTCDYHLDINTQQNYWPSETTNLSECGIPLFNLIKSLQEPGHRTALQTYGIDKGWVAHVVTNPWGFTSPGWGRNWGLHVTGGVWIATHLWEHYLFTGDREFLAKDAYPVLKGAAEFFMDYLFEDPSTGYLLSGPSVSPEMGGETWPGAVHDRAMIYDLFSACVRASMILNTDNGFRDRIEAALSKLPPFKTGFNGQLQEWFTKDDGGLTNHRHTSHLAALFPLGQITPRLTPALAAAAEKSLELRIQNPKWEDVEWSAANTVCYYARLGNGNKAHLALVHLISANAGSNLLTFSRGGIAGAEQNIFCIDGNFAGTAAITEMLLQSHADEIELLPALPEAWSSGYVKGLKARGGYTVEIKWKNGRVTHYGIFSAEPQEVRVRCNGELRTIRSQKAKTI